MTAELVDLEHALDLANKVTFAGAPPAAKAEALAVYNRVQNKLDAFGAHVMTAFEATQEHRAEGHTSPIEWQKHHCRAKGPDASRRRRTSRQLRTLPLADEALTAGTITVEHVEVLARAQVLLGEEIFAQLEAPLVEAAVDMRFSDFLRIVEYAVTRADAVGCGGAGLAPVGGPLRQLVPHLRRVRARSTRAWTRWGSSSGRPSSTGSWPTFSKSTGPKRGTASAVTLWPASWPGRRGSGGWTPWC